MKPEERTIHQIVTGLVEAWNSADEAAISESFAPDADFIDISGLHIKGRESIDWNRQKVFDGNFKECQIVASVSEVRHIRPDVAVVFLRTHVKMFDGDVIREGRSHPMIVLARENRKWQICAFHNASVPEAGA